MQFSIAKQTLGLAEVIDRIKEMDELDSARDVREALGLIRPARRLYLAAVFTCLGSNKRFWDPASESWIAEPDGPTIMKAAAFIASYLEGLPVQKTENLTRNEEVLVDPERQLEAALERSPSLCRQMRDRIDAIEAKAARPAISG